MRTSYAGLDYYGLEIHDGHARFNVTADAQAWRETVPPVGFESWVEHSTPLSTDTWYDITGVFDSDGQTLTLYVYDPTTGNQVGTAASLAVDFSTLEKQFATLDANLLFLEAPANFNGDNTGGQIELAAIWNRALNATEVASLSMVPEPGTMAMVAIAAVALLAYAWRRRK